MRWTQSRILSLQKKRILSELWSPTDVRNSGTLSRSCTATLIQRFGGSLNLNIHFHQLFVDGCHELSDKNEPIDFWVATPPAVKEIEEVLTKIIQKITKYLERQKIIVCDDNDGGFQIPIPDLEMGYYTSWDKTVIQAYDRTASAYKET